MSSQHGNRSEDDGKLVGIEIEWRVANPDGFESHRGSNIVNRNSRQPVGDGFGPAQPELMDSQIELASDPFSVGDALKIARKAREIARREASKEGCIPVFCSLSPNPPLDGYKITEGQRYSDYPP